MHKNKQNFDDIYRQLRYLIGLHKYLSDISHVTTMFWVTDQSSGIEKKHEWQ